METSPKLCRFCFKILPNQGFQNIDMDTKNILDLLYLKPNLDISEDPALCYNCTEDLQKAFEFKSTHMYSKKLVSSPENARLNIRGHFLSQKEDADLSNDREVICHICAEFVTKSSNVTLYELQEYITMTRDILEEYFSEADLCLSNAMCRSCFVSLKCYINLVKTCLEAEKKINNYMAKNTNNRVHIDLNNVLKFALTQIVKSENHTDTADFNRAVGQDAFVTNVKKENITEIEEIEISETQLVKVKVEPSDSASFTSAKEEPCTDKSEELKLHNENSTHRTDTEDLKYIDISDTKLFSCEVCGYKTKHEPHFRTHIERHSSKSLKKPLKCHFCTFQARFNSVLRKHMLVHTDPSQLRMYVCEICSYQTKYKDNLKIHMQKHSQEGHKCELCGFETKYRQNLERHMATHKDPTELQTYKCAMCEFETKRKAHLPRHIRMKHRGTTLEKYKCQMCGFEFISKSHLNRHKKTVHKETSEIVMYKCDVCPFETKYKDYLPQHIATHKDLTEVVTYKCEFCPFQSKYKTSIKSHLLLHKDVSEQPVYKCDICPYEVNRKHYLYRHLALHKKQLQA